MKPFNLQQAKAGAPVCTEDGRKVRILCTDCKGTDFPIIALIEERLTNGKKWERPITYTKKGMYANDPDDPRNLMMVDTKYKYEKGYINIYKGAFFNRTKAIHAYKICKTKKEAEEFSKTDKTFITNLEIKYKCPKNISVLTKDVSET